MTSNESFSNKLFASCFQHGILSGMEIDPVVHIVKYLCDL